MKSAAAAGAQMHRSTNHVVPITPVVDPEVERLREELKRWLIDQVELPKYYSAFVANGYDSLRFIQDIQSEQELEELGIVLRGHKRRILAEIRLLRDGMEQ